MIMMMMKQQHNSFSETQLQFRKKFFVIDGDGWQRNHMIPATGKWFKGCGQVMPSSSPLQNTCGYNSKSPATNYYKF